MQILFPLWCSAGNPVFIMSTYGKWLPDLFYLVFPHKYFMSGTIYHSKDSSWVFMGVIKCWSQSQRTNDFWHEWYRGQFKYDLDRPPFSLSCCDFTITRTFRMNPDCLNSQEVDGLFETAVRLMLFYCSFVSSSVHSPECSCFKSHQCHKQWVYNVKERRNRGQGKPVC